MRRLLLRIKQWLIIEAPLDATIGERSLIHITNGAALFIGLLGPLFLLQNLLSRNEGLAWINAASSTVGFTCLFLIRARLIHAAAALIIIGTGVLFTLSSVLFNTGMEYCLLVAMFGAVFMFGSWPARFGLAVGCAAGFLYVKIYQFDLGMGGPVSRDRYVTNLVVFLICFYVLQEILKNAYTKYQRQIERKSAELAVANKAKEKLFSIVSHDLRGPFGGLRLSMGLLKNGRLQPDDFKKLVADLSVNVELLGECLDTLLIWSSSQLREIKPDPVAVALFSTVNRSVSLLSEAIERKKISISNNLPADILVWADEDQVCVIVRNLVANALKFTPAGGWIKVSAVLVGDCWRVTVADNGIGMSPEKVSMLTVGDLVDPAHGTENERGFGLGFAICREFVQSNGGEIFVESTEGSGSRFHFTLPAFIFDDEA